MPERALTAPHHSCQLHIVTLHPMAGCVNTQHWTPVQTAAQAAEAAEEPAHEPASPTATPARRSSCVIAKAGGRGDRSVEAAAAPAEAASEAAPAGEAADESAAAVPALEPTSRREVLLEGFTVPQV